MEQAPAAVAAVTWLLSGLYLAVNTPGLPLFSWALFWFLLTGVLLAPLVIGLPVYALQQTLPRAVGTNAQTQTTVRLAILVAEAVFVFFATRFLFARNVVAAIVTTQG
jgi:hypothetical protein